MTFIYLLLVVAGDLGPVRREIYHDSIKSRLSPEMVWEGGTCTERTSFVRDFLGRSSVYG